MPETKYKPLKTRLLYSLKFQRLMPDLASANKLEAILMEYDLRSTSWICDKVKASEVYAQNLYAAMCNNDFQKLAVVPILRDQRWSASWRSAGGIIADMREEGDYIDWYCSGIMNDDYEPKGYVPEMVVTDEIREDLKQLGWIVVDQNDEF